MKKAITYVFCFCSISVSTTAFAGSKDEVYEINIAKKDSSVRASVWNDKKSVKTNPAIVYCWYAYNHIYFTRGGYDGRLLHGEYTCFYPNGNLKQKGNFKNGVKEGKWTQWGTSGGIEEISNWKEGSLDGELKRFDTLGLVRVQTAYHKGKKNGEEIIFDEGKIKEKKRFKMDIEIIPKKKNNIHGSRRKNNSSNDRLGNNKTMKPKTRSSKRIFIFKNQKPIVKDPKEGDALKK